jgi:hypothetical protein
MQPGVEDDRVIYWVMAAMFAAGVIAGWVLRGYK